jgi:hypothetical protein
MMGEHPESHPDRGKRLSDLFFAVNESIDVRKRDRVELEISLLDDTMNYYTTSYEDGVLSIEVNEIFLGASNDILEAFALVILSKFYRVTYPPSLWKKVTRYLYTDEVVARAQASFLEKEETIDPDPDGDCYDLNHVFDTVNSRYFDGRAEKPALAWSRRQWYAKFGYYMEDHNAIVISKILDNYSIPRFVLEYVMFHELLHMIHGHLNISGASESHHYYFKTDEKKFERREEAEEWLEKIYKRKRRFSDRSRR